MKGAQAKAFLNGEGTAWLERNKQKLPVTDDPVLASIKTNLLHPRTVLEVGCADGWRLIELEKQYKCQFCSGIDPSISHSHNIGMVALHRGTAADLRLFKDNAYDMVIYGFCLYLCDPEDYLKIAAEGDRVLADGGHLVIYDFYLDAFDHPHARPYKHKDGILSRKMRFHNLWSGHPAYSVVSSHFMGSHDDMTSVIILKKDMSKAFPVRK